MAVVEQPIEDGGGHHLVTKHLTPLHDWAVGGDQYAAALVAAGDQLEEQMGGIGLQRQVAQLVNDQQLALLYWPSRLSNAVWLWALARVVISSIAETYCTV